MERAGHRSRRCRNTARQFEEWNAGRRRGPKPRPINCANLESAEGRIVKVTLGPTHPPHTVGSGTCWPPGLTHAQGPVHFICIGMFKRGVFTERQAELTVRNLDNNPALQGNLYQLGMYGFGTHNATRYWSHTQFLEVVCKTMTKSRSKCLSVAVSAAARLQYQKDVPRRTA